MNQQSDCWISRKIDAVTIDKISAQLNNWQNKTQQASILDLSPQRKGASTQQFKDNPSKVYQSYKRLIQYLVELALDGGKEST